VTPAAGIDRAARVLGRGGLVVYPTDTLLGIGARATDRRAVARLRAAKGRGPRSPLSFMVSSFEEVEPWVELDPPRRAALRALLPGPYTLLLTPSGRARRALAPGLLGPGGTVGIRIPDHPVARALAARAGPVVSTSANRHGAPPARSLAAARRVFGRAVGCYLAPTPPPRGRPSTIVDLTRARPRTIRRP
jgi:L-threonylcarbamoyladenylate synthase